MTESSEYVEAYGRVKEIQRDGRPDEAARMLADLVSVYPDIVLLRWELGYAQLDAGLLEESTNSFMEAIRLDPECVPAWGGLGHAYSAMREWDRAESSFRRRLALKESPNHYLFLCEVLSAKGDYLGALRCCDGAIGLRPDSEAYLNLGLTYCDLGLSDMAAEAFEKAIELDPNDARSTAELGFLRLNTGELDLAERLLRRALADAECPPCVHIYLGLTLEAKAQYEESEREFKAAVGAGPDDDFCLQEYKEFRRRQRRRMRSE